MKKGFTLVELLIVVVVIATFMGLVFRLAGVGGGQAARNNTIARMQKLEFALSGYYAAFGSYPPVPLHGSRDIYCDVDDFGVQNKSGGGNRRSNLYWPSVRAACLSQPVAAEFPYNENSEYVKETLNLMNVQNRGKSARAYSGGNVDIAPKANIAERGAKDWSNVQFFKFGVLSFLLPRYLFMLQGEENLYDSDTYASQWRANNDLRQLLDFSSGVSGYNTWKDVQEATKQHENTDNDRNFRSATAYKAIANQSSQAVCARWMQALDGIIAGGQEFYGVNTRQDHDIGCDYFYRDSSIPSDDRPDMLEPIYTGGGYNGGGSAYYLDGMTIRDGWGNDLFYYSPPPYTGYRIWSAGPNRKTVPPWVELSTLQATDRKTAAEWISDDITGLSTPSD